MNQWVRTRVTVLTVLNHSADLVNISLGLFSQHSYYMTRLEKVKIVFSDDV